MNTDIIDPIESTSVEAATSKLSAVQAGYLKDSYLRYFFQHPVEKKLPLMNRGAYTRTTIIDYIIKAFIEFHGQHDVQIISIGSGWDTRYLNLYDEGLAPLRYYEIDTKNVLETKKKRLHRHYNPSPDTTLEMIEGDLRNWMTEIVPQLYLKSFDPKTPTLILAEVVLVYLTPEQSDSIIKWFAETLEYPTSMNYKTLLLDVDLRLGYHSFLAYEQQMLDSVKDRFGSMMIRNLHDFGILLKSMETYPNLTAQIERYKCLRWKLVSGMDMNDAFNKLISEKEKIRISKLELLDEVEEWNLLCSHYFFLLASL